MRTGAHFQHAAARHGVTSVHKQVQKYLLETRNRAKNGRQLLSIILDDVHLRCFERMLYQREGFFQDGVQIHFYEFRCAGSREIEQIVDDFAGAEGLLYDPLDCFLARIVGGNLFREHLDVIRNHRERGVHFVRHAGRQQTERSEFLGLHHLLFQAHALRDVVEKNEPSQAGSIFAHERRDGSVNHQTASGRRVQMKFIDTGNVIAGSAQGNFGY